MSEFTEKKKERSASSPFLREEAVQHSCDYQGSGLSSKSFHYTVADDFQNRFPQALKPEMKSLNDYSK